MPYQIESAIIASLTAFIIFFVKDILLQDRKRKKYAARLLAHCCRSLPDVIEMDPSSIDYSSSVNLVEKYIDVYIGQHDLDEALTSFLSIYLYWKSGVYKNASVNIKENAKSELRSALEKTAIHL